MASLVVPLFLTPPARAIGRARRGATGMAGRAVLAWSSYRQGRASSARGPPLTSSGVLAFWVRQGPVKAANMAAGAAAARAFELGVTLSVRHALPTHHISHICVCARHTGACNMLWVQQRSTTCAGRRERAAERGGPATARAAAAARLGGSNWRGRTDDWRRSKRAGVELNSVRARVIGLRHLVGCGTGPLTRTGHFDERDAAPSDLELIGQSPAVSPPIPPLSQYLLVLDAGQSRADFLFVVRAAAHRPRLALYFSPTSSPRARRSAPNDVSPRSRL